MTFQITPWETYSRVFPCNNTENRELFFEHIQNNNYKEIVNLLNTEGSDISVFTNVYSEINDNLEKMKEIFIQTGNAAIDDFTFLNVEKTTNPSNYLTVESIDIDNDIYSVSANEDLELVNII
ncbi:hypothetical protein [Acinetobacter pollinis]|uniref:hypothetical protein n=1 Tax=Acinetobacter pollinis TaxID=2605270 RepID=UPI0018A32052|nr:hypothetical protein [Acinetobacter pollinis]MBF7690395.1 hypothetical protein [Acinetobacter pollinis]MBF7693167.1 hypothetical protein [Acinetobacter pollinis]MBF7697944.1 hypothetical protein [Acinetobacter pollinis]MBF7700844.1 hypothetical protein [Acinetobacter pollinis]